MKRLLLVASLLIFTTAFCQSQSYIGQWTNNDTTFLEITSDSLLYYEFDFGCYVSLGYTYTVVFGNTVNVNVDGFPLPFTFDLSSNDSVLTVYSAFDTTVFYSNAFDINQYTECTNGWTCNATVGCFENLFGEFDTEAECIAACDSSSSGSGLNNNLLGQWTNNDTTFIEITADSLFYYEFDFGCYVLLEVEYTAQSSNTVLVNYDGLNVPLTLVLSSNDSVLSIVSPFDTAVFYSNSFDINQYSPCPPAWTCDASSACYEDIYGEFETEAECIAACDSSSGVGDSTSYLGMWQITSSPSSYLNFTTDSIFIYQFDSVDCYIQSSFQYTDIGNNQLLVSALFTSNYSFSIGGDTLLLSIPGVGDLEMVSDSFDVDSWVECTYDWNCSSTGCVDVGDGNGMYNSEIECQLSCPVSIEEHEIYVAIYPNPFSHYTSLSFSPNVVAYRLLDLTGRVVRIKRVNNQVEYLHKNQLKSGIYLLQMVGEFGNSSFERLLIE